MSVSGIFKSHPAEIFTKIKLGRVRNHLKAPRTTIRWNRDHEPR